MVGRKCLIIYNTHICLPYAGLLIEEGEAAAHTAATAASQAQAAVAVFRALSHCNHFRPSPYQSSLPHSLFLNAFSSPLSAQPTDDARQHVGFMLVKILIFSMVLDISLKLLRKDPGFGTGAWPYGAPWLPWFAEGAGEALPAAAPQLIVHRGLSSTPASLPYPQPSPCSQLRAIKRYTPS